ncbi:tubulin/FtsZ family protein [Natronobacterium gregoryi]|uniref:Tubulin-like protein CetZ n=2 Tax=Natronobacterium gregoryi TaxID=44930 RepID=L0AFS4_NATGS|nr:tubulin/FtsZ family protein [Natronobacterium gregoryi]AFZ71910.1 cell division GTPase [Natronobacterium gregoryi SP2]ELY62469.1 Tubulin/FtsZ GTPase [Natronobacterium gregoryi SP2]PLK20694.1 cell division protein [Natronobacterium gregoryi SP2]SFJ14198.1 Cell division GTPase FtsZ [Natronobacterium gregoryi]
MKAALIGVGQAGGKITERLARFDAEMGFDAVRGALAINSATSDLQSIEYVDTQLVGADQVGGHGAGGDRDLGESLVESNVQQVLDELEGRITSDVEAIFVIAGLGGGTGSGGAPVIVDALQGIYDKPVYAIGVVPGHNEGKLYRVNAGNALKTVVDAADATLLIDNDAWHEQGESVEGAYDTINGNIAQRVGLLLASGEAVEGVGASVVDSSEVINTLRSGGIAALGYASAPASEDSAENVRTVMTVSRQALLTGTSLPDATTADSALLVVAGEPEIISRKGVEKARRWISEEVGSRRIRGGDFPLESGRLGALVLLGNVDRPGRVEDLIEEAWAAKQASDGDRDDAEEDLIDDRLEGLF